jgi:hypothetical protein
MVRSALRTIMTADIGVGVTGRVAAPESEYSSYYVCRSFKNSRAALTLLTSR